MVVVRTRAGRRVAVRVGERGRELVERIQGICLLRCKLLTKRVGGRRKYFGESSSRKEARTGLILTKMI